MKGPFYIRFLDMAGTVEVGGPPSRGDFLMAYDPDYMNGKGQAHWSSDPFEALKFDTQHEAIMTWKLQSIVKPKRKDGKPNRPLTSCTVTVTREVGPL